MSCAASFCTATTGAFFDDIAIEKDKRHRSESYEWYERKHPTLRSRGPRLSQIVIHNNTVYLSGQVGNGGPDIKAQTKETCDKIDALLELAGTDKTNLLQCMIWVKDIKNDYAGMNEVYNEWIKDGKPVRACVESNMVYKQEGVQLLVEIQAIAALPAAEK